MPVHVYSELCGEAQQGDSHGCVVAGSQHVTLGCVVAYFNQVVRCNTFLDSFDPLISLYLVDDHRSHQQNVL